MANFLKKAFIVASVMMPLGVAIAEPSPVELVLGVEMSYQEYAKTLVPDNHWAAFNTLINNESNWNPKAQNPVSTAFGIGQFLDGTWATVGCEKTTDPKKQIDCTVSYVDKNYGNATEALRMWNHRKITTGHGWY